MNKIELEDENLKANLLSLVVALVEIIKDALKVQAIKRMERGNLSEKEIERLGKALMNLEKAIEEIKDEHSVREGVKSIRNNLDESIETLLDGIADPEGLLDKGIENG